MTDDLSQRVLARIGSILPGIKVLSSAQISGDDGRALLQVTLTVPLLDDIYLAAEVVDMLFSDKKINAIKHVRESLKIGLKEAKEIVDDIQKKMEQDAALASAAGEIGFTGVDDAALEQMLKNLPF